MVAYGSEEGVLSECTEMSELLKERLASLRTKSQQSASQYLLYAPPPPQGHSNIATYRSKKPR
jgi:hypothetical protein